VRCSSGGGERSSSSSRGHLKSYSRVSPRTGCTAITMSSVPAYLQSHPFQPTPARLRRRRQGLERGSLSSNSTRSQRWTTQARCNRVAQAALDTHHCVVVGASPSRSIGLGQGGGGGHIRLLCDALAVSFSLWITLGLSPSLSCSIRRASARLPRLHTRPIDRSTTLTTVTTTKATCIFDRRDSHQKVSIFRLLGLIHCVRC
jgi:hypothetical protein